MIETQPLSMSHYRSNLPTPRREADSALTILGATFRQEYWPISIGNKLAEWTNAPSLPSDPKFNPLEEIRDTPWEDYGGSFVGVKNSYQMDFVKQNLMREWKDREIIANSGMMGFASMLAAGIVDPINLVPVGWAYKGAKGFKAGFKAGVKVGFPSVAASEIALNMSQETRTTEESLMGIGMGTVISGLLSGVLVKYGNVDADLASRINNISKRMQDDMDDTVSILRQTSSPDVNKEFDEWWGGSQLSSMPGTVGAKDTQVDIVQAVDRLEWEASDYKLALTENPFNLVDPDKPKVAFRLNDGRIFVNMDTESPNMHIFISNNFDDLGLSIDDVDDGGFLWKGEYLTREQFAAKKAETGIDVARTNVPGEEEEFAKFFHDNYKKAMKNLWGDGMDTTMLPNGASRERLVEEVRRMMAESKAKDVDPIIDDDIDIESTDSKSFLDEKTKATADTEIADSPYEAVEGKAVLLTRLVAKDRSQGGGHRLLKQVFDYADELGLPVVTEARAYGNKEQKALVNYYQKRGFEVVRDDGDAAIMVRKPTAKKSLTVEPKGAEITEKAIDPTITVRTPYSIRGIKTPDGQTVRTVINIVSNDNVWGGSYKEMTVTATNAFNKDRRIKSKPPLATEKAWSVFEGKLSPTGKDEPLVRGLTQKEAIAFAKDFINKKKKPTVKDSLTVEPKGSKTAKKSKK